MSRASLSVLLAVAAALGAACASPPPAPPAPVAESAVPGADGAAEATAPAAPTTWDEALVQLESRCPGPFFALSNPTLVEAAGRSFSILGSTLRLEHPGAALGAGRWKGPVRIGVLGAIKDADPDTRVNIKRAAREFKRLGVHIVVANGDLVGDEAGDLTKVVRMLGEEIKVPVLAHSGNYEWTSAFTAALAEGHKSWPHLFNANLLRHVDLGGVHLFSLPGWSNRRYVKPGACFYGVGDVRLLEEQMAPYVSRGDVVILTAHGPPRGRGRQSIDFAHDAGNVGDEELSRMVARLPVRFGLFSHILEAGGRATTEITRQPPLRLPMARSVPSLYVNAGSASSFGWEMLSGKTTRGMAAVLTIDDLNNGGRARVKFLTLR